MALHGRPQQWDELPDEIWLQILGCLEPNEIIRLRLVSRKLREVCHDDKLWKQICFDQSRWYYLLENRRSIIRKRAELVRYVSHSSPALQPSQETQQSLTRDDDLSRHGRAPALQPSQETQQPSTRDDDDLSRHGRAPALQPSQETQQPSTRDDDDLSRHGRALQSRRDMSSWDPEFPGERASWYDEYVQRHGPTSVNWLQTPRSETGTLRTPIEARGMALYNPSDGVDGPVTMLAVSPLDDGSVCLWDVNGNLGRRGGIVSRSSPEILFIDGPGSENTRRSKKIDTGVTECVSVDNFNHRAYFAVQSHLIEVDLNRLDVVSRESFEWSITTMSVVHEGVPLTVGTSLGIHLHDFRARTHMPHEVIERLDGPGYAEGNPFKSIFDPKPLPPYASLSQPTPTSILHLPQPGCEDVVSNDVYVAGRFSNILHYDRRKFPSIVGSIYSGARLSSMAALPYVFSTKDHDQPGEPGAQNAKQLAIDGPGRTIFAGGEYNTKGSLERYGLMSTNDAAGCALVDDATVRNRQTAASATILSVINHGTRIVFSDGTGLVKWFERDGITECRRLRIGHSEAHPPSSLFASMPGSDDLARKILSARSKQSPCRPNEDNILFWTGEKLGLISSTQDPIFDFDDFEIQNPEEAAEEEESRGQYAERMREALQRHADDVRFLGSLEMGV